MLYFCVRPPTGYNIIRVIEWYSTAICEVCVQGNVENIPMGVSKFQYFFQQSYCATSMGVSVWRGVGPATFLLCLVNILNFSWSRWPQNDTAKGHKNVLATIIFNSSLKQGLIHKRLNKVCDSFEMLCSNCLNHWEYLLWEKGLGTKLYDGKSVLKMPLIGRKQHVAKNWKFCFLFISPSCQ